MGFNLLTQEPPTGDEIFGVQKPKLAILNPPKYAGPSVPEVGVGPGAAKAVLEQSRSKGFEVDARGRSVRRAGTTQSAGDYYKTGAGAEAVKQMEGKTPVEQAVIARETDAADVARRARGISVNAAPRNSDGSLKRMEATKAPRMFADTGSAVAIADAKSLAGAKYQGPPAATQEKQIADAVANAQGRNVKEHGTVAVDPKYAGPGQLTTDTQRGVDGKLGFVKAAKAATPWQSTAGNEREFKQGSGEVFKTGLNDGVPVMTAGTGGNGMSSGTAMTNPTGKPIAALQDASFMGNAPAHLMAPAEEKQSERTVGHGITRDQIFATNPANAVNAVKPIAVVPPVPTAVKPIAAKKDEPFSAPIKFSMT